MVKAKKTKTKAKTVKSKKPKAKKKVTKKAKASPKDKGGRPSKYKPEMNVTVRMITEKGFTDVEIAAAFGISKTTLNSWKKKYPKFMESLKKGKDIADEKVERSLYEIANGYSHPDVHISNYKGKITVTPIIKHYPPVAVAAFFWLKNRKPDDWKDRKQVDIGGQKDNPLPPLTFIFKKDDKDDKNA